MRSWDSPRFFLVSNSKRPEGSPIANRVNESNSRDVWIGLREKNGSYQRVLLFAGNSLVSRLRMSGAYWNLIAIDIPYASR